MIEDGHFIESFDSWQHMMSEQMRQGILHFNLDVIHGFQIDSLSRIGFEDAVIHRCFDKISMYLKREPIIPFATLCICLILTLQK